MERAGNWVDTVLGSTPFTAPIAKLGHVRSAGITDLRYGHVVDEDWQGHDRFRRSPDRRQIVPLPEGVACYAIAATLAPKRGALADRLLGDALCPCTARWVTTTTPCVVWCLPNRRNGSPTGWAIWNCSAALR